jgi:hypothetical protein
MRITERRLRSIIRSVIKESQMNEMIDMINFGTSNEVGPHGDLEYSLKAKLPRNSREAEECIRTALVKLNSINQIIPQSSIATIPAIGAAFATGHHMYGAVGVGVFIASALFEMLVTDRIGAEEIDGIEQIITYLDKNGHRKEATLQRGISDILDKEGY